MEINYVGRISGSFRPSGLFEIEGTTFKEIFDELMDEIEDEYQDKLKESENLVKNYYNKLSDYNWLEIINEATSYTSDEETRFGNWYYIVDGKKAFFRKRNEDGSFSCYIEGTDPTSRIKI